jgi:hypothetical protein
LMVNRRDIFPPRGFPSAAKRESYSAMYEGFINQTYH